MKKGFTLVEIVIATLIVGMLSVLLMRTYIMMTRIAFRVQQEKNVTEHAMVLTQVVQNFADTMTIDYSRYAQTFGTSYLADNTWLVSILYLTGQKWTVALYSSGSCVAGIQYTSGAGCRAVIERNTDEPIVFTQTGKVNITKRQFKIIPYASQEQYLQTPSLCQTSLGACLYHPWFWMLTQVHTPYFLDTWESNVHVPIQVFFSVKK